MKMMAPGEAGETARVLLVVLGTAAVIVAGAFYAVSTAQGATLLPHPSGCPRKAYCGCGTSVEIFGRPVRNLFLARNWFKFPRTSPAPGMVAVRRGHVMVLRQHLRGNVWLTIDHNSGRNRSRLHARSIAGFTIVNPRSSYAEAR